MRKKESWMLIGAIVLANGNPGTIAKIEENNIDGNDYVYYIHVKLEHHSKAAPYHPNDVRKGDVK